VDILTMHQLAYVYLRYTNMWDQIWPLLGLAIRLAIDRGIHRLKNSDTRTVENELCIRAFWILRNFDICQGIPMGRPPAITTEDFDLDYPAECDDEYWQKTESNEAFSQPSGKLSLLSYFTQYNKLMDIAGSVQKNMYSIRQSSDGILLAERNHRQMAIEYDSKLNNWLASLPEHLRWDPQQPNKIHLNQSALLYVCYYWVQGMPSLLSICSQSLTLFKCKSTKSSLSVPAQVSKPSLHSQYVPMQRGLVYGFCKSCSEDRR
jgi:hypothetical protein